MKDLAGFRPMLGAAVESLDALRYPLLASPKLDGIRAIWWNGQFYSRSLKLIPNAALSAHMLKVCSYHRVNLHGVEGELIAGDDTGEGVFNRTSSQVMTRAGSHVGVRFFMFDQITKEASFTDRWGKIPVVRAADFLVRVPHRLVESAAEAANIEAKHVDDGYEGMILRDPAGRYKQGRSTLGEQGLLKVKRFLDAEAPVIGFEEKLHNANELTRNELGYAHRTSHKANKEATGMLGSLLVKWGTQTLGIGTGFTDAERLAIWMEKPRYLGKLAKFKYLPTVKDLPRHPVFLGFREKGDL